MQVHAAPPAHLAAAELDRVGLEDAAGQRLEALVQHLKVKGAGGRQLWAARDRAVLDAKRAGMQTVKHVGLHEAGSQQPRPGTQAAAAPPAIATAAPTREIWVFWYEGNSSCWGRRLLRCRGGAGADLDACTYRLQSGQVADNLQVPAACGTTADHLPPPHWWGDSLAAPGRR